MKNLIFTILNKLKTQNTPSIGYYNISYNLTTPKLGYSVRFQSNPKKKIQTDPSSTDYENINDIYIKLHEKYRGGDDLSKQLGRYETHIKWLDVLNPKQKNNLNGQQGENEYENDPCFLTNNNMTNLIKMSNINFLMYFYF